MDIAILFGLLFVLLALSVPIGISLGIATAVTILTCSHLPLVLIAQNAFTGMDSFPMLAIPFFMLAGSLMTYGGISRRIVDMAECFVGFITGGLAMVTIVACMFFGAISGSAAATVSAIGSFMVPMMVEKNTSLTSRRRSSPPPARSAASSRRASPSSSTASSPAPPSATSLSPASSPA